MFSILQPLPHSVPRYATLTHAQSTSFLCRWTQSNVKLQGHVVGLATRYIVHTRLTNLQVSGYSIDEIGKIIGRSLNYLLLLSSRFYYN
jgi:hypothetical protein